MAGTACGPEPTALNPKAGGRQRLGPDAVCVGEESTVAVSPQLLQRSQRGASALLKWLTSVMLCFAMMAVKLKQIN